MILIHHVPFTNLFVEKSDDTRPAAQKFKNGFKDSEGHHKDRNENLFKAPFFVKIEIVTILIIV